MLEFDSEEDTSDELFDAEDDLDAEADDDDTVDPLLANMAGGDAADDVTDDGDDDSVSEESDEEEDEEEDEDEEDDDEPSLDLGLDLGLTDEGVPPPSASRAQLGQWRATPTPPRKRSLSPATRRRMKLAFSLDNIPRSYTIEAICAIPHPVPTHALAASACITHLLTGSEDGYIRDYDVFAAVNSKSFLTAPQRHHAGVVEGLMKSGQLRYWWENPGLSESKPLGLLVADEEPNLAPVYSLAMHRDALWALAGTDGGYINLFTVRHDPGRLCHVLQGHRGPVSGLALDYDEKGVFSASWDGEAIQWDLNTGQNVRNFTAHNSQLTSIALRPISSGYVQTENPLTSSDGMNMDSNMEPLLGDQVDVTNNPSLADIQATADASSMPVDTDARSDVSFDPLFDDIPEDSVPAPRNDTKLAMPWNSQTPFQARAPSTTTIPPPKGAPPLFDPVAYSSCSPDLLMTAFIDGQVILWDRRAQTSGHGVGRLWMSEKTPPWCLSACWSADGAQIYAGRRNGTVDVWDVRVLGQNSSTNTPRLLKTLRNPTSSGVVSCVVAFPDSRHIACASVDNIRLWNVAESGEDAWGKPKGGVPFKIIPGHHGGYISQMIVDPGARFLVSASSNRGWYGDSTRTVFVHDIKRNE
ncbi:WD40-repeat-containing domain protein [Gymnopilus junonius]|uniref:WD40-repeat-containing domain protein n=1 Tax=Gymnopilus junonius TaxID=109634 RepID=A0A9P5TSP2_GYMJU|nr:WD40-repeat-containing domain protein [Gymnopilus junonius]